MLNLRKGRYRVKEASSPDDLSAALALRARCFRPGSAESDFDTFDESCTHILIEERKSGALVCCFRLLPISSGKDISSSYSAQFYELSALQDYDGKLVELGRFCIDPAKNDPDILRIAWGAMTRFVDAENVQMLFGCSSFHGTSADQYYDAFALLKERHLAPKRWLPKVKSPNVFRFADRLRRRPNQRQAAKGLPPLLKTYLMMGGWVSDHAVVDQDLNTLHVFTGLEINAIPAARKRLLRAVMG